MSKNEKALERLKSKPADFTWAELKTVMLTFGFRLVKGHGSGRKFIHEQTGRMLLIHEPHPKKVLKHYQIRDVIDLLQKEGFI